MALIGQTTEGLDFFPDSPPSIVGELGTGHAVNIELWEDGVIYTPTASGCTEINSTGRYTWSTSGIPVLTASRQQFHWRMSTSGSITDEGDFVLVSIENRDGGMPPLGSKSSYIVQN